MSATRKVLTSLALALLACGAVLALATSTGRGSAETARDIAADLACPSCEGQSVAESDSPVAAGMRETIARQLAQGRTPEEVRAWFTNRYGAEVLRPGSASVPLPLSAVPVGVVAAVLVGGVAAYRRRRPCDAVTPTSPSGLAEHRQAVFLTVGGLAVFIVVGVALSGWWIDRSAPTAIPPAAQSSDPLTGHLLDAEKAEEKGDYRSAAEEYRMAAALSPDPAIRLREAFSLLRAGQPTAARSVLETVRETDPDSADVLLLLGLSQRASGDPAADRTLRTFLSAAPDHPAAAEVRPLLGAT